MFNRSGNAGYQPLANYLNQESKAPRPPESGPLAHLTPRASLSLFKTMRTPNAGPSTFLKRVPGRFWGTRVVSRRKLDFDDSRIVRLILSQGGPDAIQRYKGLRAVANHDAQDPSWKKGELPSGDGPLLCALMALKGEANAHRTFMTPSFIKHKNIGDEQVLGAIWELLGPEDPASRQKVIDDYNKMKGDYTTGAVQSDRRIARLLVALGGAESKLYYRDLKFMNFPRHRDQKILTALAGLFRVSQGDYVKTLFSEPSRYEAIHPEQEPHKAPMVHSDRAWDHGLFQRLREGTYPEVADYYEVVQNRGGSSTYPKRKLYFDDSRIVRMILAAGGTEALHRFQSNSKNFPSLSIPQAEWGILPNGDTLILKALEASFDYDPQTVSTPHLPDWIPLKSQYGDYKVLTMIWQLFGPGKEDEVKKVEAQYRNLKESRFIRPGERHDHRICRLLLALGGPDSVEQYTQMKQAKTLRFSGYDQRVLRAFAAYWGLPRELLSQI